MNLLVFSHFYLSGKIPTADAVTELLQNGLDIQSNRGEEFTSEAMQTVHWMTTLPCITTVFHQFMYEVAHRYLDILLDRSGRENTVCTVELPYDQAFINHLQTKGWYVEMPSNTGHKEAPATKMVISNITHTPHGGY